MVLAVNDPARLRPWHAQMSRRLIESVRLLVVSDSIHEGNGTTNLKNRSICVAQRRVNLATGLSTGVVFPYVPGFYGADYAGAPGAITGGSWSENAQFGLGLRTARLNDKSAAWAVTQPATRFRLHYARGSGAGILHVTIDGEDAVVLDSYLNAPSEPAIWLSPTLPAGTHTITVTQDQDSTRPVYVSGAEVFNGDTVSGLRIYDASQSGYRAQQFAATDQWAQAAALAGPIGGGILSLGANDAKAGRTPDQYRADLLTIIGMMRSTADIDGTIILTRTTRGTDRTPETWSAYGQVLTDIVSADPTLYLHDLAKYMPDVSAPPTAPANLGLYDDEVHPSDAGNAYTGDLYADLLVPRIR